MQCKPEKPAVLAGFGEPQRPSRSGWAFPSINDKRLLGDHASVEPTTRRGSLNLALSAACADKSCGTPADLHRAVGTGRAADERCQVPLGNGDPTI
jgi:hypothetical protein